MSTDPRDSGEGRAFTPPTVDTLARCEDEPIHVPGAVQPHGCLLEVEGTPLRIRQVSSNVRSVLAVGAGQLLGQTLDAALAPDAAAWASEQLASLPPATLAARQDVSPDGQDGTLLVHHYLGRKIVEWVADAEHRFPVPERMDRHLESTLAAARRDGELQAALDSVAEGVKAATGYDRVMVYRFHPDWHGEIVAEKTEPGLPAYRGIHYPASDIPAQARRLYLETHARVITDVYARDAVLMETPGAGPGAPLDLSHAWLRSVSRVHIQYLRNMGSGATLVTSLIVKGRLWGLIACHHRTPYSMPWYAFERMRQFTRTLSQVIADRLATLEATRQQRRTAQRQQLQDALRGDPQTTLALLLGILGAEAVVVQAGSQRLTLGQAPFGSAELPSLVLGQPEDVGHTDGIHERFSAASCDAGCAGIAWVVLSRPYQLVLAFVRPEFQTTVTWGGDPDKAVVRDPVTRRLSPRGSFDLWKETVSRRSRPWDGDALELLELVREGIDVPAWVAFVDRGVA